MAQAISGEARYGNAVYPFNNLAVFGDDPNDQQAIERGLRSYCNKNSPVVRSERPEVRIPGGRVIPAAIVWHYADWSAVVEFAG